MLKANSHRHGCMVGGEVVGTLVRRMGGACWDACLERGVHSVLPSIKTAPAKCGLLFSSGHRTIRQSSGLGNLGISGIERALGRQAAESMAILPFGARDARQRQLIESEVGFSIQRAVDVIDKADNSSELRLVVASDQF